MDEMNGAFEEKKRRKGGKSLMQPEKAAKAAKEPRAERPPRVPRETSGKTGKVVGIEPVELANGSTVSAVVIENDFQNNWVELHPAEHPETLTAQELQTIVREAGIVGMGGATFPTYVKLKPGKPIDAVLISGSECEPYLTADHRVMLEFADDIVFGLRDMMKAVSAPAGVLIIADNKPDATAHLDEQVRDGKDHILFIGQLADQTRNL